MEPTSREMSSIFISFNPHSRKTPSGTCCQSISRLSVLFQSSLEENPEWNMPMIMRKDCKKMFQSSLEENPEWNPRDRWSSTGKVRFQSSLEENPEWNSSSRVSKMSKMFQSSLEENPEWNWLTATEISRKRRVSILTRGKPRVEPECWAVEFARAQVSILTRGKPRVELVQRMLHGSLRLFQSSLEENPEWNFASAW